MINQSRVGVSRNQPCPCGSGKKFKRCCVDLSSEELRELLGENRTLKGLSKKGNIPQGFLSVQHLHGGDLSIFKDLEMDITEAELKHDQPFRRVDLFVEVTQKCLHLNIMQGKSLLSVIIGFDGVLSYYKNNVAFMSHSQGVGVLYKLLNLHKYPMLQKIAKYQLSSQLLLSYFNLNSEPAPLSFKNIMICIPELKDAQTLSKRVTLEPNKKSYDDILGKENSPRRVYVRCEEQAVEFLINKFNEGSSGWRREKSDFLDFVQFQFSDGVLVSLKEILFHPYGVLLPSELYPEMKNMDKSFYEKMLWPSENPYRYSFENDIRAFFFYYLENISKKSISHSLFLVEKSEVSIERSAYPVKGVKFLSGKEIKCVARKKEESYCLSLESDFGKEKDLARFDGVIFNNSERILTIHPFDNLLECLSETYNFILGKTRTFLGDHEFSLLPSYFLGEKIVELKKVFFDDFAVELEIPGFKKIETLSVGSLFELESNEPDRLNITVNVDNITHRSMLQCLKSAGLVKSFFEGIGSTSLEDNKDIAFQSQGQKRRNDLKVLKHVGFYYLLCGECLKVENKNMLTSKKMKPGELKKAYNEIENILASFLDKELNFPYIGTRAIEDGDLAVLTDYVSRNTSKLIKNCIKDHLCLSLENNYFVKGEYLYEYSLVNALKETVTSLFHVIVPLYGEKIFLKNSFRDMKITISEPGDSDKGCSEIKLQIPGILSSLLKNSAVLPELLIDGKKINYLEPADLGAQLDILENEDPGKIDWFELNPRVFLKGVPIDFESATKLQQENFVQFQGEIYVIEAGALPALKWLNLFWEKVQGGESSTKKKSNGAGFAQVPKSRVLEMLALRKSGVPVIGGAWWKKICAEFDRLDSEKQIIETHDDFKIPLKKYQFEGYQWMMDLYNIELGGVLADDMGLGKTVQTLAFLEEIRLRRGELNALIIVPTSLIYNWKVECEKFTPGIEISTFESTKKENYDWSVKSERVILCSYGLFTENIDFFNEYLWDIAIFDEAQSLKNIRTKRTTAARVLRAKSKFCLTGTPMENHFGEFYSLIDLCVSGALGSYQDFMKTYSFNASDEGVRLNYDDIEFLKMKTAPLVLRRHKSDVLEQLPKKTETLIRLPFEKKQAEIYRDIAISWNEKVQDSVRGEGESSSQLQMLTALLRLRQVCSYPASVPGVDYNVIPPKLELLLDRVEVLKEAGESVLVFTNFVTTLKYFKSMFQSRGHNCLHISGDMSQKKRQETLRSFDENSSPVVLLMTLKTGGVGLNLTKASYVFHIEPWWNPAAENQGTDRVHRMGQTKKVQVYRYIMEDSVEEKINLLKKQKGEAFDALFCESEKDLSTVTFTKRGLSMNDFELLLN